jgi:DNA invertase Pin-like site-specific DNA recombinase
MKYGYARVSSDDQNTDLQRAALKRAGVTRVVEEKRSGVRSRPALEALLDSLKPGDTVLVYKVDRLARSLVDLLRVLARIEAAGCSFRSLTEPLEVGTPVGRLMLQLLGSFAEFERAMIRERCAAGTRAAKERGVVFGRPRSLDWDACVELRGEGFNAAQIAARFGVHHTAVRWAWKHHEKSRMAAAR